MSEVLKEQEKVAGITLEALAPTIRQKKPTMHRWGSVETQIASNNANAAASGGNQDTMPTVAARRISDASSTDSMMIAASKRASDASRSVRISDSSFATAHFRELAEFNSMMDLPPQMVARQDTNSSENIPDLSPLGVSARGRLSAVLGSNGRRSSLPELSPPRGGGRKELSPPQGAGRKGLSPPQGGGRKDLSSPRGRGRADDRFSSKGPSFHRRNRANNHFDHRGAAEEEESDELEHSERVEELDDLTPAVPPRCRSPKMRDQKKEKKPRPISPKIWSRSGTKRIHQKQTDVPPAMANRRWR